MKKLKSYLEFINEEATGEEKLKAVGRSLLGNILSGKQFATGGFEPKGSDEPVTIGSSTTTTGSPSGSTSETPEPLTSVPGNDDYLNYMQHQQGIAGSKQLIRASKGIDKLHPETVKTRYIKHKGKNVKYANLIENVPSDRPNERAQIIKALDAGNHKTAADVFLKMWKETWNAKSEKSKSEIDKPQNAEVKSLINKYCSEYKVPYDFARTVAFIESGFDPRSGSDRPYKGIYALSPAEFSKRIPGGNIFKPEDNIKAGIEHIKEHIVRFKKYLGSDIAGLNFSPWIKSLA